MTVGFAVGIADSGNAVAIRKIGMSVGVGLGSLGGTGVTVGAILSTDGCRVGVDSSVGTNVGVAVASGVSTDATNGVGSGVCPWPQPTTMMMISGSRNSFAISPPRH